MLKVIEFFAGIGSQAKALKRQNIKHEIVGISEWEVNAIISYDAIHTDDGVDYTQGMTRQQILEELKDFTFSTDGKDPCDKSKIKDKTLRQLYNANKRAKNLGDITKIKTLPKSSFWTYSFPCQDLSISGKRAGLGEGTRSGLLYEIERLLGICKENNELPACLLLENVKNLVGKEFKPAFEDWIKRLDELGYNTYWQVLNAKNYGIPQNRERVFAVSIRKDIRKSSFEFPKPFDSGFRLKDFLETNVDEKFYISDDRVKELIEKLKDDRKGKLPNFQGNALDPSALSSREHRASGWSDTVGTLCARDYKDPKVVAVEPSVLRYERTEYGKEVRKSYESGDLKEKIGNMREPRPREDGISNTITTVQKDNLLLEPNDCICVGRAEGINGHDYIKRVYSPEGISPTIVTVTGGNHEVKIVAENEVIKEFDIPQEIINDNERQRRVYNTEGISPTVLGRTDSPKIVEDFYANRDIRVYDDCPTIRADRHGLKVVEENELKFVGGIQTGEMWIQDGKELSRNFRSGNRIYDSEGIAVAQTSEGGGLAGCTGMYMVEDGVTNGCSLRTRSYIEQEQQLEVRSDQVSNSITTVQKDSMVIENTNKIVQLNDPTHSQQRVYGIDGISPTISAGNSGGGKEPVKHLTPDYRIRKLTPTECWRLMGFDDEDINKCMWHKEIKYIQGGTNKCSAKLKIVNEKQKQSDMETYVSCTTKGNTNTEMLELTKIKKLWTEEQSEKMQNVNIVIELLEELGLTECATNIIKCTETTETLYTLMQEKDQPNTVIIELGKEVNTNIGKYMKITLEENLNQQKLYTTLTLIEQIIQSKIYTYIKTKASIKGHICIIENLEKNLKVMKLSNLNLEYITRYISDSMLYKQAGNSIVVNVLEYIFESLFKKS